MGTDSSVNIDNSPCAAEDTSSLFFYYFHSSPAFFSLASRLSYYPLYATYLITSIEYFKGGRREDYPEDSMRRPHEL